MPAPCLRFRPLPKPLPSRPISLAESPAARSRGMRQALRDRRRKPVGGSRIQPRSWRRRRVSAVACRALPQGHLLAFLTSFLPYGLSCRPPCCPSSLRLSGAPLLVVPAEASQLLADGRLPFQQSRLGPVLEPSCHVACPDACADVCLGGGGDSLFAGIFWAVQRALLPGPFGPSGKPCLSRHRRSWALTCFPRKRLSRCRPAGPIQQRFRRAPGGAARAEADEAGDVCSLPLFAGRIAFGAVLGIAPCVACEPSASFRVAFRQPAARLEGGRAQGHHALPPMPRPR